MPKLSVCIEMLFKETHFYERPSMAAVTGFEAVEFWGARDKKIERLKSACGEKKVRVASFLALDDVTLVKQVPEEALLNSMGRASETARKLNVETLIVTVGNEQEGTDRSGQKDNIVNNLKTVAPVAEAENLKLAVEPLNTVVDHPGYFLYSSREGLEIVERVGSEAVGLLYDVYHMQIMEGNLIETIRKLADIIYHVHLAGVPGRHEPGTGEINWTNILKTFDQVGYEGFCGFEFVPTDSSVAALARATEACGL